MRPDATWVKSRALFRRQVMRLVNRHHGPDRRDYQARRRTRSSTCHHFSTSPAAAASCCSRRRCASSSARCFSRMRLVTVYLPKIRQRRHRKGRGIEVLSPLFRAT
jgi:hypothetical protein